MSSTFRFSVVTPSGIVLERDVEGLVVEGLDGYYGLLAGHVESLFALKNGIVRMIRSEGDEFMLTSAGILEAKPAGVTLLTTFVLQADSDIDAEQKLAEFASA